MQIQPISSSVGVLDLARPSTPTATGGATPVADVTAAQVPDKAMMDAITQALAAMNSASTDDGTQVDQDDPNAAADPLSPLIAAAQQQATTSPDASAAGLLGLDIRA